MAIEEDVDFVIHNFDKDMRILPGHFIEYSILNLK